MIDRDHEIGYGRCPSGLECFEWQYIDNYLETKNG